MSSFYVRSRGKVAGPFDLTSLKQMAKRGRLNRFDQLSADQASWRSAGEIADLFPSASRRSPTSSVIAAPDDNAQSYDLGGAADRSSSGSSTGVDFFYAQNGIAVGPVTLSVLQMLATNGTLRAEDQVWADGSEIATPARQVPMLASVYSGSRILPASTSTAEPYSNQPLAERDASASVAPSQRRSMIFYLVAASLIIIFTMMPVAVVRGVAFWWWMATGWSFAANIYTLVSSAAVLIVAPLISRFSRPISVLTLTVAPLLVSFIYTLGQSGGPFQPPVILVLAIWGSITFTTAVLAIDHVRFTLVEGGPTRGAVVQIVFGAFLSISSILGMVSLILASDDVPKSNGIAIMLYALACLGVLSTLAAGIVAILAGSIRPFKRSLNLSSLICAWGGGSLICTAIAVFLIAMSQQASTVLGAKDQIAIAYVILRMTVLVIATLSLVSVSLSELLVWSTRHYALPRS